MVIAYTPEEDGLKIALDIIVAFIDAVIEDIGGFIWDILTEFFAVFLTFIFGGGLTPELAFSFLFSLMLFGVFWKYVWTVVN